MHDVSRDSIYRQLTARDDDSNTDLFAVFFDTYNTGISAFALGVTSAGVQLDALLQVSNFDFKWDVVWDSKVQIDDKGWCVEMRIPYSALRFSKKPEQLWGINFIRQIRRVREVSFYNHINPDIQGMVNQSGELSGIQNIESPLRLSFYPYLSTSLDHYPFNESGIKNTSTSFNGGMDVKYGISPSFTLDMTLIPDFGQVASDNNVLNLSPFEVRFDENRQFFTEGTELFSKGGLFYSRRIGGRPVNFFNVYNQIRDGETVKENPSEARLINATKLSGRTPGKLGVGLFNAMTSPTYATITDADGGEYELLTQPFTNYNIFVLDQTLKNNSSISLVNTNVMREGSTYDADVTGLLFNFYNKKRSHSVSGSGALSQKYGLASGDEYGHKYAFSFGKVSGKLRYEVWHNTESDTYDPNDAGFLFSGNERNFGGGLYYQNYDPGKTFVNRGLDASIFYGRLFAPDKFTNLGINLGGYGVFHNYLGAGVFTYVEPVETYDYFEARVPGRKYNFPINYNFGGWVSSDYRKKFALDVNSNYRIFDELKRARWNSSISPRYRFNDKFNIIYSFSYSDWPDDVGYVDSDGDPKIIYFGARHLNIYENRITTNYIFNPRFWIKVKLRQYWSTAKYTQFFELDQEGDLQPTSYNENNDVNFNAFNVDFNFVWRFAPGSEFSFVWKNQILHRGDAVVADFYDNLKNTIDLPHSNNVSIKVLYYIDYQRIKSIF